MSQGAMDKVRELRAMYEAYVAALSAHLLMSLPPWRAGGVAHENWRTSAWGRGRGRAGDVHEED
jgi:hypothetical protein